MEWLNIYGLIIVTILMIPNIIFTMKIKEFENKYYNKFFIISEQFGRYGSMFLMIFNIGLLEYGFLFKDGLTIYLVVNGLLCLAYCIIWIICFSQNTLFKVLSLSIIPTIIFGFSGIMTRHILLIITSILFGIGHITISYKNKVSK